jgi:glycosyltransferase involved in cell wall biosynthesis
VRIGIDARLAPYRRGMGNQIFNLLQGFSRVSTRHELILYVDRTSALASLPEELADAARVIGPSAYAAWEQITLPRQVRRDRLDVLHCPGNTGPLAGIGGARLVLTVFDVMFLLPREVLPAPTTAYQRLGRMYRRWNVPRAAGRASRVVTISQHARDDVIRVLGLPAGMVEVIETGPGPEFRRLPDTAPAEAFLVRHGIRKPYVLGLAAADPRKNVAALLRAFARVKSAAPDHQLVLGGCGPRDSRRWQAEANRLDIATDVVFPGFVSQDDLVALYNLADVFVFPSLYEGFGLPVTEAMACGAPVIASCRGAIPEAAGGAAVLIEPSVERLASALIEVLQDRDLRAALRRRGQDRVSGYSWPRSAAAMLRIYEGSR